MAGVGRDAVDMASIYDCYTITVLMSLEDAGFCDKGKGMEFVASHDMTASNTPTDRPPMPRPNWHGCSAKTLRCVVRRSHTLTPRSCIRARSTLPRHRRPKHRASGASASS
jgi:hypothetical protein